MARFPARHQGDSLVPLNQEGRDALNRVPHGGDVMISITKARNIRQHNLFWKLCEVVANNFDVTKDAIKDEFCEKTGHVYPEFRADGSMRLKPKSIAFENMKQDEFEAFFKLVINYAASMLGSAPQEVIDHVNSLLDPQSRWAPSIVPTQAREREREDA